MFCANCGSKLETGDVFCPYCGTKVISAEPVQEAPAIPQPEAVQASAPDPAGKLPLPSFRGMPASSALIGMKAVLTGSGVLILLASLLPVLDFEIWGYKYSANIYRLTDQLKSMGVDSGVGWVAIVIVVTAMLAIGSGISGISTLTIVSGATSAGVMFALLCETESVRSRIADEMGIYGGYADSMLREMAGPGLYLILLAMAVHAALALYIGIKKM